MEITLKKKPAPTFDRQLIKKREQKLNDAKAFLKTKFIGIDNIIDKFIDSVRIWYILPEIQTRPLIINLFGITGVGKTDLIRSFVNYIEFGDKFAEVQMDSGDGYGNIEDYLENILDDPNGQGILLLDEIQRFRTIDDSGHEIRTQKFQDVWMLLSDGSFQNNSKIKQQLISMILESKYWDERENDSEEKSDKKNAETEAKKEKIKTFKYKMSLWEASRIKKLLSLPQNVEEIMLLSSEQKLQLIKQKLNQNTTFECKKYSRLLIVISGNLDEAFTMSDNVSDSDNDADVYHEYSKTIDIIQIKNALSKRFKPEQIARFGNIHMIYPIPNREAYFNIIKQKIQLIVESIKKTHNINIHVDNSVYQVIYNNGVFPTQGVRPVISTISSIFENSLPYFIFEYLNQKDNGYDVKKITIKASKDFLYSEINGVGLQIEIPTVLDDIKKGISINTKTKTAVHEAGHAVMYALLNKAVPTQIVCSTTSENVNGFVGIHTSLNSKIDMLNKVQCLFGGRAAEELVFGVNHIASGASSDYHAATAVVCDMYRILGMGTTQAVYTTPAKNGGDRMFKIEEIDREIEKTLNTLYNETKAMLKANIPYLVEVSDTLLQKEKLTTVEFQKLSEKYVGVLQIVSPKDSLEINYSEQFQSFKSNMK